MASTPGQRAMWRAQRSVKANNPVNPHDLELMQAEGIVMDIPPQLLPLSPQVQLLPNQPEFQQQSQDEPAPSLSDITPPPSDRKPNGKREKDWFDYWSKRFGPQVLIVLWFTTASRQKAMFYAPSPDECGAIALPMARVSVLVENWLKVPAWVHDVLISTDDLSIIGMTLISYLDRIGVLTDLVPYFTGQAAKKMKDFNEPSTGATGAVPSTNGYEQPIDLSTVAGLGEQYRPV